MNSEEFERVKAATGREVQVHEREIEELKEKS